MFYEPEESEILGRGGLFKATLMLRLEHPNGDFSLISGDVYIPAAPEAGDLIVVGGVAVATVVGTHDLEGSLVISTEAEYPRSERDLLNRIIGCNWEVLSVDHEMN